MDRLPYLRKEMDFQDPERQTQIRVWVESSLSGRIIDPDRILGDEGGFAPPSADRQTATRLLLLPLPTAQSIVNLLDTAWSEVGAAGRVLLIGVCPPDLGTVPSLMRLLALLSSSHGVAASTVGEDWFGILLDRSGRRRDALNVLFRQVGQRVRSDLDDLDKARMEMRDLKGDLESAQAHFEQQAFELDQSRMDLAAEKERRHKTEKRLRLLVLAGSDLVFQRNLERWKLRRLRARRWWRFGEALRSSRRNPLRLISHLGGVITDRPPVADPPERKELSYSYFIRFVPPQSSEVADPGVDQAAESVTELATVAPRFSTPNKSELQSFRSSFEEASDERTLREAVVVSLENRDDESRKAILRLASEAARVAGWIDLAPEFTERLVALSSERTDMALHAVALFEAFELHRFSHASRNLRGMNLPKEYDRLIRQGNSYLRLVNELAWTDPATRTNDVVEGRVVSFLHNSLPYSNGGYATRAHGLLSALHEAGLDIKPYSRPGFPMDLVKSFSGILLPASDTIDGITYNRLFGDTTRALSEPTYMLRTAAIFESVLRQESPELVHGRSTYLVSAPALLAARAVGVPFVYEVSGLWELVHASRPGSHRRAGEIRRIQVMETLVARSADHVLTLTEAMRTELIARGVDPASISLVPNSVDAGRFTPRDRDVQLADELLIPQDVPVIGYVGSFQDYEGLDDLVDALGQLSATGTPFRAVLVGDGHVFPALQDQVRDLGLTDQVNFAGRVTFDQVEAYYSLIDIAAFPRKPWPVCEMVAPMKPLEPMALGKAIVVSSVQPLVELVRDGETGLVYPSGDPSSLAAALESLCKDASLRRTLGAAARQEVTENRSWTKAASAAIDAYTKALSPVRSG